jgi:predicted membrane channel-forming protein YqfA (hemolysin III family)
MIIENMFKEHTARRYLQGSAQKIKTVAPTYLIPMASTKVNTTAIIGCTCFGVGLIGFTIVGSLYLFQRAERKRWHNQNDEVLIDGIVPFSE